MINYDPPREFASYLHRAGRSCRGESTSGVSISLLLKKKDRKFARFLLENLQKRGVDIPKELRQAVGKKSRFKKMLEKRNREEVEKRQELGTAFFWLMGRLGFRE